MDYMDYNVVMKGWYFVIWSKMEEFSGYVVNWKIISDRKIYILYVFFYLWIFNKLIGMLRMMNVGRSILCNRYFNIDI